MLVLIVCVALQGGPRGRPHSGWLEQSQGGQRGHHLRPASGVPSSENHLGGSEGAGWRGQGDTALHTYSTEDSNSVLYILRRAWVHICRLCVCKERVFRSIALLYCRNARGWVCRLFCVCQVQLGGREDQKRLAFASLRLTLVHVYMHIYICIYEHIYI